jgi:alpha,alpha-trehalose phosphorylase
MAARNLLGAVDACGRHPEKARELGVSPGELAGWRHAAERVVIPYDEDLGVHEQSEGFTHHEVWDFDATRADQYPLLLDFPYFDLYRKQVVKQPDLVLAMQLFRDYFTPEQRARNFDYYERITVRDSSLSACTEAVAAADAGHLRLAYDYTVEAALVDLRDLHRNTRDGLHLASLAGTWIALVMGFGGVRDFGDCIAFAPRLPEAITRLAFSLRHRERCLHVDITSSAATYMLSRGTERVHITHHGEALEVGPEPVTLPIPAATPRTPPVQPHGREPMHRPWR